MPRKPQGLIPIGESVRKIIERIRKAREDMNEGVITSTMFFSTLDKLLAQSKSYQVFRSHTKPQPMED